MTTELEDCQIQYAAYRDIIENALNLLDSQDPIHSKDCVSIGIKRLQAENRKLYRDLAEARGWAFVPSHDVPSECGVVAVPDSWVHCDKETVFDVKECT